MSKQFIISEEEKRNLKSLYLKKGLIYEQSSDDNWKNYPCVVNYLGAIKSSLSDGSSAYKIGDYFYYNNGKKMDIAAKTTPYSCNDAIFNVAKNCKEAKTCIMSKSDPMTGFWPKDAPEYEYAKYKNDQGNYMEAKSNGKAQEVDPSYTLVNNGTWKWNGKEVVFSWSKQGQTIDANTSQQTKTNSSQYIDQVAKSLQVQGKTEQDKINQIYDKIKDLKKVA